MEVSPKGLILTASRLKGCEKAEQALRLQYEEMSKTLVHRQKACADIHIVLNSLETAVPYQPTPTFTILQGRAQIQQYKGRKHEMSRVYQLEDTTLKIYAQIRALAEKVLSFVSPRRAADVKMHIVRLQQAVNHVVKENSRVENRLRRRSSFRSVLKSENKSTHDSISNFVSNLATFLPRDYQHRNFVIRTISTVIFTQDPILCFSLQQNQKPFFSFEAALPDDFLKNAVNLSHTQFRASFLQISESLSSMINAMHYCDLGSAPQASETAGFHKRNWKQRLNTEKSSLTEMPDPEEALWEGQGAAFVTQNEEEDEDALQAREATLELEEAQFYETQRYAARLSSAALPRTGGKARTQRLLTQETRFQGCLRHLNAVGKSLRVLGIKRRMATGHSQGNFSASLLQLTYSSFHPAKSASLSFSESTTASKSKRRA